MQLSLPGEVEIATAPRKFFDRKFSSVKRRNTSEIFPFQFSDGQVAGFSHLYGVSVSVMSQPLDAASIKELRLLFLKDRAETAARLKADADPEVSSRKVARVELGRSTVEASRTDWQGTALVDLNGRLAIVSAKGDKDAPRAMHAKVAEDALVAAVNGLIPRELSSVPAEPGLCLPYAFSRDNGTLYRDLATTYRLLDHPDITVLLKDATAATHQYKEVLTAKYRTNDFWAQYGSGTTDFRSVWSPSARDVELGGQAGMQTFVQFVRKDGTLDFGYLAVAPGDPNAKQDIPDLMLYVIRDAKNAKAKGIEPMSQEALIEMAQSIVASVKRRPVSP